MIQVGEIPSVKFGRTSRMRHQDLDDFIQNHVGLSSSGQVGGEESRISHLQGRSVFLFTEVLIIK